MANIYNKGFHTLMSEAGILSSKSFTLYINDVVGFNNLQELNLDGFTWNPYSSITYDFVTQMIAQNRIKCMATYTDKDSEAIPFGTQGFETTSGVLPVQKARFIWDADDYRHYLDAVAKLDFMSRSVKEYALDLLFNGLSDIKNAHELSMTYQRDQMISNRGLKLDANNNPRGIKGLVFTVPVPKKNITSATSANQWFTDTDHSVANVNADPIADIKKIIRGMKREGIEDITIEVDYISWLADMEHPNVRKAFGYALRPELVLAGSGADTQAITAGTSVPDDEVAALFARQIGIPLANIKFRKGLAGVEVLEGKGPDAKLVRKSFRTFNANTYVFYPSGPLGTIESAMALVPDDSAMYATFLDGKGIVQYDYDNKSKVQDWWSELAALCVPQRPQDLRYLITKSA